MDREDEIMLKLHDAVLWAFLILMVVCLCVAASKEGKQTKIIDELEKNIISLEEHNDRYAKEISELNEEISDLNVLLDTTKKQYEDRIAELEKSKHDDELRYYSNESLQRGYKLTEEVWIN